MIFLYYSRPRQIIERLRLLGRRRDKEDRDGLTPLIGTQAELAWWVRAFGIYGERGQQRNYPPPKKKRKATTPKPQSFSHGLISCQTGLDVASIKKLPQMGSTWCMSHWWRWLKRRRCATITRNYNFLSEGVRCGLDKEIAPDGTYLTYFPFGAMIERAQMAPYHRKFLVRK